MFWEGLDKGSKKMRQTLVRKINRKCHKNEKIILMLVVGLSLFYLIFGQCHKAIPISKFHYPSHINMSKFVEDYQKNMSQNLPLKRTEYKLLSNPKFLCSKYKLTRERLFLIFLIKSKTENIKQRNIIRETWANDKTMASNSVKRVFLIGNSKDVSANKNLEMEIKYYEDIVLINYIDNYDNNTIKTLSGMRWLYEFCKNVDFVMLVDDDYFVATNSLLTFLKTQDRKSKLFMGYEYPNSGPFRFRLSKWYVSFWDYEFDTYPRYISGGAVVMTKKMATSLYIASKLIKPFKIDDVYLGIIAHQLDIKPQHNQHIYVDMIPHTDPHFKTLLASHGYSEDEMRKAWKCHQENRCHFSYSTGIFFMSVSIISTLIILVIILRFSGIVHSLYFIRLKRKFHFSQLLCNFTK